MKILFVLILTFFPLSAFAEDISIAPECKILKEHIPDANVAYKSGVDVTGNPVVPADINVPIIDVPEILVVPLTIDLGQNLEGAVDKGVELKGTTGFLEISKNGRVTYDGADVTSQVYMICGQKTSLSNDRQKDEDIIKSDEHKYESIK